MPSKKTHAILIVDDEEAVRLVISKLLSARGYQVETASSAEEALIAMESKSFDVLLTDHMMGEKTGLDLIVETNRLYPDIVKVLLTGFGDRNLYLDAINKGAVFSVIEKPSDADHLINTVQRALEFRNQRCEEKREIEKLRKQYHTIFARTTDLIQCINIREQFIYVNPAWHNVLGYDENELKELRLCDIIHEDYYELYRKITLDLKAGKQVEPFETVMIAKDKREVYLEGSATGQSQDEVRSTKYEVRSEKLEVNRRGLIHQTLSSTKNGVTGVSRNAPTSITYILRDVTERKRAGEEIFARLKQETMIARIADLLARMDDPVSMYEDSLEVIGKTVNADRAYIYALNAVDKVFSKVSEWKSPSFTQKVDLPEEISFSDIPWIQEKILNKETITLDASKNLPEPDRSIFKGPSNRSVLILPIIISTCVVGVLEFDSQQKTRTWNKHDINMLEAASDIIANAWTRQIEIDVRKQKEKEAAQSRLLVIRADRLAALGTMTAGIIHEITQPLNVISVSAQTILYGSTRGWTLKSEQVQNSLNLIIDQIKRMDDIITNMRAFSQDGLQTSRTTENINTQVERVFTMIGEQMKVHDIEVEFNFGDISEISMNTHQILQVILNLVTNARQALDEKGSDNKKIVIGTGVSDNHVILEVADNGPGIPESLREKIFDPFFTTKEVGKGTGLGLSISTRILHEHNGELLVRDNDMGGATFIMRLPLSDES